MRIYISGPMTGKHDLNRHAFDAAAKLLRDEGHFVINPHDFTPIFGPPNELRRSFKELYSLQDPVGIDEIDVALMKQASRLAGSVLDAELAAVRSCNTIYLLHGWESSRGAKIELQEALKCGLRVILEEESK